MLLERNVTEKLYGSLKVLQIHDECCTIIKNFLRTSLKSIPNGFIRRLLIRIFIKLFNKYSKYFEKSKH